MSYCQGSLSGPLDMILGAPAALVDLATGATAQRQRARASTARAEDLRRQTAELQAQTQTGSEAVTQEAARRAAEIEASAAEEAAARKKKLIMQLGIGGAAVLGLGAVIWFATRD